MGRIPMRLIERLMKEYGAKRVSKEAKEAVIENINKLVEKLTQIAVKNARHFGRKLVMKEDIEAAIKYIFYEK